MTVERGKVRYGEQVIAFSVVRRDRKTLEIAVEPDTTVVVAAPYDAPVEAIAQKVRRRAAWVRRQQRYVTQFMTRTSERLFVPGDRKSVEEGKRVSGRGDMGGRRVSKKKKKGKREKNKK